MSEYRDRIPSIHNHRGESFGAGGRTAKGSADTGQEKVRQNGRRMKEPGRAMFLLRQLTVMGDLPRQNPQADAKSHLCGCRDTGWSDFKMEKNIG